MNKRLADFARATLKEGLAKCSKAQVNLFKRMYSHHDLCKSINDVVDDIPEEKLNWAMEQIQNTFKKADEGGGNRE